MDLIDHGEFFEISTEERRTAIEIVIKTLRSGPAGKGKLVERLHNEAYKQRSDCKDFLKNLERSCNHEIYSRDRMNLSLGRGRGVTSQ